MDENKTYDGERLISNYGFEVVDRAFRDWWNDKLNLHLTNKNGEKIKVPIQFVSSERWYKSREVGVRDEDGKLIVPIIIISRTGINDASEGPTGRQFADTLQYHTVAKQADKKSSRVQNLVKARDKEFDPSLPIYEIYTVPAPDHFSLTYEVGIWVPYMEDMNEAVEKIGQQFNYKSQKSFKFKSDNGLYFVAFKEDEISDDSNIDDYSGSERIIRKRYSFTVPAHMHAQSNEREDLFRRYFSQTKLVIKTETTLSSEETEEIFGKK